MRLAKGSWAHAFYFLRQFWLIMFFPEIKQELLLRISSSISLFMPEDQKVFSSRHSLLMAVYPIFRKFCAAPGKNFGRSALPSNTSAHHTLVSFWALTSMCPIFSVVCTCSDRLWNWLFLNQRLFLRIIIVSIVISNPDCFTLFFAHCKPWSFACRIFVLFPSPKVGMFAAG